MECLTAVGLEVHDARHTDLTTTPESMCPDSRSKKKLSPPDKRDSITIILDLVGAVLIMLSPLDKRDLIIIILGLVGKVLMQYNRHQE